MIALVTGGSGGIGTAICRAMLAAGWTVISLALEPPEWTHARLLAETVDLRDAEATARVAGRLCARHAVTHVVHNAGVIRPAMLGEATADDMRDLAALHLVAPMLLVQAALPGMRERRFGRIVLLSSRAALGAETRTAYSATKSGMIGMARTWALELAGDGITVNVVAPGPVVGTRMFHDVVPAGSEREARLAAAIPVGRLGTPEDVAHAVMFFGAEAAGFVTGQTLFVCGGASVSSVKI